MSVITVSREFGSGGSAIARRVAKALGCHFVNKDNIAWVLSQYGLAEFREEYDAAPPGFWARFDSQRMERRDVMVSLLNQTLLALARHGNVVILGRCGFAVLQDYADVLHVRVQAPLPFRVQRVMAQQNLDPAQAEARVKEGDKVRAGFVESCYGVRWDTASSFDVVINTGKVTEDRAVQWIIEAAQALGEREAGEGASTRAIAPDHTLASAVAAALQCRAVHSG